MAPKKKASAMGAIRAASSFFNRAMLSAFAGLTFHGKRNLYDALGYKRLLRPEDMLERYRRGGLAARVVEAMPKATWRGGVEVLEDEDPKIDTQFEEEFREFSERLGLWSVFQKADVLAGMGQFSVILIGGPGPMDQPLERCKADDIKYLAVYSQRDIYIKEIEKDETNERFGYPLLYQIQRLAGSQYLSADVGSKMVHWTRIVHVADEVLDDRIFGNPRLERVWNYFDDLEKIVGGGAEAFWKRADQGIIFDLDKELEIDPTEATKVKEAADDFIHGYRRTMSTRGMKAQRMGSDVADFSPQVDAIITLIAGASGIPKRILVGSERGELASTQDRENWEQRISDRRSDFGDKTVLRPVVQRFIDMGAFTKPTRFFIKWPEIEYLSDTEKADIADTLSKVNAQAKGVVIKPEEIRSEILGLETLSPADLADAEEKLQAAIKPPTPPQLNPDGTPQVPPPQPKVAAARKAKAQIAGETRARLRYHALKAFRSARKAHDHGAVRNAMHRGHDDVMLAMTAPLKAMKTGLSRLSTVLADGHHRTRQATKKTSASMINNIVMGSHLRVAANPAAGSIEYSVQKSAELITSIDEQTRQQIVDITTKALDDGWSANKLSSRLEDVLGLNGPQSNALENFRTKLEDGEPGDEVSFGDRVAKIPADGGSDEWIDKQVGKYSDDMLAQRADAIAQNMTSEAVLDGQREGWQEMVDDGELSEDQLRRFVASAEACDECQALDGETAVIGEPYSDGSMGPLIHNLCGCDEELAK